MTTYSVRCRHNACRHRRVTSTHPDEYKVVPKCPACGKREGWRIEQREYNKRGLCTCSGPEVGQRHGERYPHRTTHPLCDQHPEGLRNQALARGVPADELPLELMGEPCDSETAPF
jgi:hypothetical protein